MNELANIDVKIIPAEITFDLAPVKELVNTLEKTYTNWVVKEEDLKSATDTIAQINNVSKSISDKRIAIGKDFKKPFDEFEKQVKTICAELDALSKSIKDQTDEYENKRKATKKAAIESLPSYNKYIAFNEKWLNKGTSIESVIVSIDNQNYERKTAEDTIKQACDNLIPDRFIDMYHNGTELSIILSSINAAKELASRPIIVAKEEPQPEPLPIAKLRVTLEKQKTLSAQFSGTETQYTWLKVFCADNNILIEFWEIN